LCSEISICPLKITEEGMRWLLGKNRIGSEFLDLLFAMGRKPRDSEAGLRKIAVKEGPEGTYGKVDAP
jgi:hypothetical protein